MVDCDTRHAGPVSLSIMVVVSTDKPGLVQIHPPVAENVTS